ncbi:hypothetical protein SISNIDRAFT_469202 [Sistotremastrum niveocremeum HHB9708]|uniref:Uncharacterized protein n=1 Tax=Sistotremastrum niveocremeum HHB9708 TaxID=1314777 RepID=A0A164QIN3_9AGAM|nr:hypothetical protein SISNIDRAFT_469202 [Sistotremastrum niveocremeum HHB9708]
MKTYLLHLAPSSTMVSLVLACFPFNQGLLSKYMMMVDSRVWVFLALRNLVEREDRFMTFVECFDTGRKMIDEWSGGGEFEEILGNDEALDDYCLNIQIGQCGANGKRVDGQPSPFDVQERRGLGYNDDARCNIQQQDDGDYRIGEMRRITMRKHGDKGDVLQELVVFWAFVREGCVERKQDELLEVKMPTISACDVRKRTGGYRGTLTTKYMRVSAAIRLFAISNLTKAIPLAKNMSYEYQTERRLGTHSEDYIFWLGLSLIPRAIHDADMLSKRSDSRDRQRYGSLESDDMDTEVRMCRVVEELDVVGLEGRVFGAIGQTEVLVGEGTVGSGKE